MKFSAWTKWGPQRRRAPASRPQPPKAPPWTKLVRHAEHDPTLVCRPAGTGMCEVLSRELSDVMNAQVKPKRQPAIHYRYGGSWPSISDTTPPTACGKWVAAAWNTTEPADVTCRACRRTVAYRAAS